MYPELLKNWRAVAAYFVVGVLLALSLAACGSDTVPSAATVITGTQTTTQAATTATATTQAATLVANTTQAPTTAVGLPTVTPAPATAPATTASVQTTTAAIATAAIPTTAIPTTATTTSAPVTTLPAVAVSAAASTTVAPTTQPASTGKALLAYVEAGQLYILDPATKDKVPALVGDGLAVSGRPDWSPDNSQLVVPVQNKTSKAETLYLVSRQALVKPKQLTATPADARDTDPRFSPDGQTVLFTRTVGGNHELWLVDRAGQQLRKLANGSQGVWSPDGQRIAFVTDGATKSESFSPQNNALHLISAKGQNEWEPASVSKMPTDLTSLGYPFGADTLAIQYPTWLDGGKTIGFTTVGHSGLLVTVSSTNAKDLKIWDTQYEGGFGVTDSAAQGSILVYETYPPSGFSGISLMNTSGKPDLKKPGNVALDNPRQGVLATRPALSADGSRLAFLKLTKEAASGPDTKAITGTLTVAQLKGGQVGEQQEILKGQIAALVWSK